MKFNGIQSRRKDTGFSDLIVVVTTLLVSFFFAACDLPFAKKKEEISQSTDSNSGGPASTPTPSVPKAPEIISVTPSGDSVEISDTIESNILFSINAKSDDGEMLSYAWSVNNTVVTNFDRVESWSILNAQHDPSMTLTVVVTDQRGLKSQKVWKLTYVRKAIFVRTDGSDSNTGTRWSPVRTLSKAYQLASSTGISKIVVASGAYSMTSTIGADVSLYGSYTSDFRSSSLTTNETSIDVPSQGLLFQQIQSQKLEITGFVFKAPKSTDYATNPNSVAVKILKSRGLEFKNNKFISSDGMDGADGASGVAGAPGGAGANGAQGTALFEPHEKFGIGGSGGTSSCGVPGGRGGDGAKAVASPISASWGQTAYAGGMGGQGGVSTTEYEGYGGNGGFGLNGFVPASASNGINATSAGIFTLNSTGWSPQNNATDGTNGAHGSGGGGGGGGGAYVFRSFWIGVDTFYQSGGGGGGGGAGGCGGTGGKAAKSGGGSFAVMVIDSIDILFLQNTFKTANGGKGGIGGEGALGGAGGQAGSSSGFVAREGIGGAGGRGSAGAKGGKGGAGAGGPSIGILDLSSTITQSENIFDIGLAGTSLGSYGIRQNILEYSL